jgi:hypothetical protein
MFGSGTLSLLKTPAGCGTDGIGFYSGEIYCTILYAVGTWGRGRDRMLCKYILSTVKGWTALRRDKILSGELQGVAALTVGQE